MTHGKPRFAAALLAALTLITTLVLTASPAQAFDGRVPDSRPATPVGEITALYWHGLDRDPDQGGLNNYMSFVNENCHWGILDASYRLLTSTEARNRWHDNPQTLAGMLYASLLNRAPDAGGVATYTNAIRDRGIYWSVTQMLGSAEYRARLDRICAGRVGQTANVYDWQTARWVAQNIFIKNAKNEAAMCGFTFAIMTDLSMLQSTPYPPAIALGRVAEVVDAIVTGYSLDGTCESVVAYLRAAYRVYAVINGSRYNPVFMQWSVGKPDWFTHQRKFTIRIGPNPTSWRPYSGQAW